MIVLQQSRERVIRSLLGKRADNQCASICDMVSHRFVWNFDLVVLVVLNQVA